MSIVPETQLIGPPTHYTSQFDDRGQPMAITWASRGSNDDVGGKLPDGWDDQFWQWEPSGDPKGAWVQQVDKRRADLWAEIKRERAAIETAGVTVEIGGRAMRFQTDRASIEALRDRMLRMRLPDAPETTLWTLADDSREALTLAEMEQAFAAAVDHADAVHGWSQDVRAALHSADVTTLDALNAIRANETFNKGQAEP